LSIVNGIAQAGKRGEFSYYALEGSVNPEGVLVL